MSCCGSYLSYFAITCTRQMFWSASVSWVNTFRQVAMVWIATCSCDLCALMSHQTEVTSQSVGCALDHFSLQHTDYISRGFAHWILIRRHPRFSQHKCYLAYPPRRRKLLVRPYWTAGKLKIVVWSWSSCEIVRMKWHIKKSVKYIEVFKTKHVPYIDNQKSSQVST